MKGNKLSGELPASLAELESLDLFMIQGNEDIEGSVPDGMCELEPSVIEADCDVDCLCCTDNCERN